MNTKCKNRRCLVHGFGETASRLLVKRAFDLMIEKSFSEDELRMLWQVVNGKR
jgi:hypothetical protein